LPQWLRSVRMAVQPASPGRFTCQYIHPSRLVWRPSLVSATPPAAAEGLLNSLPSTSHRPFSIRPV